MSRVLILAYGNPLRCDDGVGWRVADALQSRFSPADVEILCLHQLAPELAENVSRAGNVIFVDASQPAAEAVAGTIAVSELPLGSDEAAGASHHLSPQNLMMLASRLFGAAPRTFTVTVTGSNFAHGESLSPEVESALPDLIARLESLIQSWLG